MSHKYFRCEYVGDEPNDNLEMFLKVRSDSLLEEYVKRNKGKAIKEIETEEMLQNIKKELFG